MFQPLMRMRVSMLLGYIIVTVSIVGVIYGIINRNKIVITMSILGLIGVIAVWIYFYNNPY